MSVESGLAYYLPDLKHAADGLTDALAGAALPERDRVVGRVSLQDVGLAVDHIAGAVSRRHWPQKLSPSASSGGV